MRVFNEDKTQELKTYDLKYGYLKDDKIKVGRFQGVDEQGHYEDIADEETGEIENLYVIDIPMQSPYDIYEDIQVFVPYSTEQVTKNTIIELKELLQKYKEDVEQVELFGMERSDYAEKKQMCADIILQLRQLEASLKNT